MRMTEEAAIATVAELRGEEYSEASRELNLEQARLVGQGEQRRTHRVDTE